MTQNTYVAFSFDANIEWIRKTSGSVYNRRSPLRIKIVSLGQAVQGTRLHLSTCGLGKKECYQGHLWRNKSFCLLFYSHARSPKMLQKNQEKAEQVFTFANVRNPVVVFSAERFVVKSGALFVAEIGLRIRTGLQEVWKLAIVIERDL